MVKVYFETGGYAELVAIFDSEESYQACYESLEKLAKRNGFKYVTESVQDEVSLSKLNFLSKKLLEKNN